MDLITILVSQTSEDMLAETIAAGIRRRRDVALFVERVVPIAEISSHMSGPKGRPTIVILVGSSAELDVHSNALLDSDPGVAVVRIAIGSELVHMDLRHLDLNELISSARAMLQARTASSGQRHSSYRLVSNGQATQHGGCLVEIVLDRSVLDQVLVWLDAVLLLHLQRSTDLGDDDRGGLSLSRATVELSLKQRDRPTAAQLSAQEALEIAAVELVRLLDEHVSPADPLAILCTRLELSNAEIWAFLLCLAPEIDTRYQRVFGFVHDDLGRRHASLGLIALVCCGPLTARLDLAATNRLFDWRLIEGVGRCPPHADEPLRIDPNVLAWLLGSSAALVQDEQLAPVLSAAAWSGADWLDQPVYRQREALLKEALCDHHRNPHWLVLTGANGSVWRALLEDASNQYLVPLLRIALAGLGEGDGVDERLLRLARGARLTGAIPVLDTAGMDRGQALTRLLGQAVRAFNCLPMTCVLRLAEVGDAIEALPLGDYQLLHDESPRDQPAVFSAAAREAGLTLATADIALLAAAYPLPFDALARALNLAAARGARTQSPTQQATAVGLACQMIACPQLPTFATLLAPSFHLDQLVLPHATRRQLDDIVAHVRHAATVLSNWGFGAQLPYGRGVAALFSGASGTGKTMAARAIGHALQRSVFAVDLSRVLSKYIGEMEKNLNALFNEAEQAGAILLFDEADALFGKRSEAKDAHDRYANIETAYLLQRMEAFNGLAILTTNFGKNLDRAFIRRLRFIVDFPAPQASDREKIWQQCMPKGAPTEGDIDFASLARRVDITGGNIRQITLRAAFSAAAEGSNIGMRHIVQATRAEALKLGLLALERDLAEQAAEA